MTEINPLGDLADNIIVYLERKEDDECKFIRRIIFRTKICKLKLLVMFPTIFTKQGFSNLEYQIAIT